MVTCSKELDYDPYRDDHPQKASQFLTVFRLLLSIYYLPFPLSFVSSFP
jgi:hypothetical protein